MATKEDLVPLEVRVVLPTSSGSAVFLSNEEKTFVIYVDQSVGAAITMFMRGVQKERPLTHDLIELRRAHPRFLKLRERATRLDGLVLARVAYQKDAVIRMESGYELVHLAR